MVNVRSDIWKPSLIINTICVRVNLGNVQGTFFWWYLQGLITTSYISKKITKFTVFARGGGEGDGDGELEMLELIFEHSSE